jgi:hypothetical protein
MSTTNKITPSNPRMATLLGDVQRGNIKIPVFQRDYVWTDEQIMSLLDSIYHGYPVGSLLLWSTKERLIHDRNVGGFKLPETPEDYPVNYVLDGQQRLTTLYGVFNSNSPTLDAELANRFNVCFMPDTEEFAHISTVGSKPAINLRLILDTTTLLPELQRFDAAQQSTIARLTERFKDYEFPVVTIKDRTNQEVCRVFQRINSSGTTLSTLELLAAWTWSEEFDLREQIDSLLERLAEKGYEALEKTEVLRCLTALVNDQIDPEALVDVKPSELVAGVTRLKEAMFSAIDFLEKDIRIKNVVFLPFPIMLVPLVYFFALKPKPTAPERNALRRWFWHCAFTQRYKAGTNRLVREDLEKMRALAKDPAALDGLKGSIESDIFKKTWRINSTVAKAAICLLAQLQPKSLLNGAEIDLSDTLSAYNARQFHHIYPKAFLNAKSIHFHEANVIANICMLTASDNNFIDDADPAKYFPKVPAQIRNDVFARALIPKAFRKGEKSYSDFINARSMDMALAATSLIEDGSL